MCASFLWLSCANWLKDCLPLMKISVGIGNEVKESAIQLSQMVRPSYFFFKCVFPCFWPNPRADRTMHSQKQGASLRVLFDAWTTWQHGRAVAGYGTSSSWSSSFGSSWLPGGFDGEVTIPPEPLLSTSRVLPYITWIATCLWQRLGLSSCQSSRCSESFIEFRVMTKISA